MTTRFSFFVDERQYLFVDEYSNYQPPLPNSYITYPIYSGMRSSCVDNSCSDCLFGKAARLHHGACHLPLIESPYIAALIPDHIKQSFPELFI